MKEYDHRIKDDKLLRTKARRALLWQMEEADNETIKNQIKSVLNNITSVGEDRQKEKNDGSNVIQNSTANIISSEKTESKAPEQQSNYQHTYSDTKNDFHGRNIWEEINEALVLNSSKKKEDDTTKITDKEQDDFENIDAIDSPLKRKVQKIITDSQFYNNKLYDNPPLILKVDKEYLNKKRMWKYFAWYFFKNGGLAKIDSETGEPRPYKYSERFEISKIENGMWLVYGIANKRVLTDIPKTTQTGTITNAEPVTAKPENKDETTNNAGDGYDGEAEADKTIAANLKWQYTEETITTKGEQIEKGWDPVYSSAADPVYGKDIKIFTELTKEQKEKYQWDAIRVKWREVNNAPGISDKTLDQWIRKNLAKGWKDGDIILDIKEIKVKFDAAGNPIIQAHTFTEAWKEAGKLGLGKNQNQPFYWERKLSGKRTKYFYNFAPPEVYYNRTTLKSANKSIYVNDMFELLGNEEVKANVMTETGFEEEFAEMVKQTQQFLGVKVDGKMTPETIKLIGDKAAASRKVKDAKAKKDAEDKQTFEIGYFKNSGKKDDLGRTLVYYYYHNTKDRSIYVDYDKVNNVNASAKAGSDMDSPVYELTNDETFRLDFDARMAALSNIAYGYLVPESDEESLVKLLEFVPPHEYGKVTTWITKNPIITQKIKYEVETEKLRQKFNNLMANRYNFVDKNDFKEVQKEVNADSYSADSKAYQLSDKGLQNLEYDNQEYDQKTGSKIYHNEPLLKGYKSSLRIQTLRVVASGYRVGGEDESTLIRYLTMLPEDQKVARSIRTDIAKELLKKQVIGDYTMDMALLRCLHDVTNGSNYPLLRSALDQIFEENGGLLAAKIKEKLKNPASSQLDIEAFGEYGSKEAYKYLSNAEKIQFIKKIMDGDWEGDTDEQTIIEVLQSVGMPTAPVDKKDPKAVAAAQQAEEHAKQSFYNDLVLNRYGITDDDILDSIQGEEDTTARRLLNSMDKNGSQTRKNDADNETLDRGYRRDQISYMSDYDFQTLTEAQRETYLKLLVELDGSGWTQFWIWTGDAQESAINKIIQFTPKEQSLAFSKWLYSKTGNYNDMKSAIDGAEYTQFHEALNTLAETKRTETELPSDKLKNVEASRQNAENNPDDANAQMQHQKNLVDLLKNKEVVEEKHRQELSDIDMEKMQSNKVLPWGEATTKTKGDVPGKTIKYSYDMELIQAKERAYVQITMSKKVTNTSTGDVISDTSKPLAFNPDEMIGVYFLEEMEGVAGQYELLKMPAINFDRILNEEFKKKVWQMVDFAALLLSFMPLLRVGLSGLARVIAYADATIMALSIIVNENKKSLPDWFLDAFSYIQTASMVFIFVGNPKKLIEAEEQLGKLDDWLKTLSAAEKAVPGFEDSVRVMRETLEQQIRMAKMIDKADEATLRKMLKDLEETPLGKLDDSDLINAIKKRLADLSGTIVKASDEVITTEKKVADAAFNKGQKVTLEQSKAAMAEKVVETTEKGGNAVVDGDKLILKGANGEEIASPVFASRKQMADWLLLNKFNRYIDAHTIAELEKNPKMYPWFFDKEGKLLTSKTHPHLYDGERPLTMAELFGKGGKFSGNPARFGFLQALGDFKKAGTNTLEDIAVLVQKAEKSEGAMEVAAFRQLLAKEGVELGTLTDDALAEIMRKSRLYPEIANATKRQKDFMQQIMKKHVNGEIDDEMATQLREYNRLNRYGERTIENVIEQFDEGKILTAEGLFSNPNVFERSGSFRKESFASLKELGVNIPEEYETLFQAHHIILWSFKNDAKFGPFLEKIGFDIDDAFQNGLPLLANDYAVVATKEMLEKFPHLKIWEKMPKHLGGHSDDYKIFIQDRLDDIMRTFNAEKNANKATKVALQQVKNLTADIVNQLEAGTLKLNK